MIDYIFIVSATLLVIGIALLIALPFCRMADDGDDEQAPPVDSKGFPFDPDFNIPKPHRFGVDRITHCHTGFESLEPTPLEPTPLECAEARVAMGEPVASAARNEGILLAELMDYLRANECQPTK